MPTVLPAWTMRCTEELAKKTARQQDSKFHDRDEKSQIQGDTFLNSCWRDSGPDVPYLATAVTLALDSHPLLAWG
jgi:hypothetical protein